MGKGHLVRSIVRRPSVITLKIRPYSQIGALNWATGETVAVKEIQLSNIPKGELGEIMVRVWNYISHARDADLSYVFNL